MITWKIEHSVRALARGLGYPAVFILLALLVACNNDSVSEESLQSASGYSDVKGVKLQVGKLPPDFSLQSIEGSEVVLSELRGRGVMLIFYRGYWCPFCIGHLEDIQSILPELDKKGIQVVAISPDSIDGLKTMASRLDNPYWFLSDPKLEVIERYGIRKDEKLPHPAVVLIDKKGLVQWFYVGENYKQRPSASQLRAVIEHLDI
jgi:peroxiredoxin